MVGPRPSIVEPPLPVPQHASSVGRAVVFLVRDTIVEQLRAHGYDATNATAPTNSSYRALIVSGKFRVVAGVVRHNNWVPMSR